MYETTIPQTAEARQKRGRTLSAFQTAAAIFAFAFALLAIALFIAFVVLIFVLEFGNGDEWLLTLLIYLFVGGTILFAVAGFCVAKLSEHLKKRRDDFLERCDSTDSFFVGEGTLATFTPGELVLHALHAEDGAKPVRVPYAEMRFFSVCTRKRPRERGEWSVVAEIPSRYLLKDRRDKHGAEQERPLLVQMDQKPRLYETLAKFGLPLLGEERKEGTHVRYKPIKKFYLPNIKKQRNALIWLFAGAALAVGGIPVAVFLDVTVGTILCCLGVFLTARQIHAYFRARALLAFFREGLYWRESDGTESMFLKWEELTALRAEDVDRDGPLPVLTAVCLYGEYHFPRPKGAREYLRENFPEKFEDLSGEETYAI